MASDASELPKVRHVGPMLATAIIAIPLIFYWLLLRRGYSPSTRRAALVFMITTTLPMMILGFASPP